MLSKNLPDSVRMPARLAAWKQPPSMRYVQQMMKPFIAVGAKKVCFNRNPLLYALRGPCFVVQLASYTVGRAVNSVDTVRRRPLGVGL